MDSRSSLGVRRHNRTRGMESLGHTARHIDFRHLESAADARGARHDSNRHRNLWPVLCAAAGCRRVIKYAAFLLSWVAAATAAGADLARCIDIDAPEARLACYDAVAHPPANRTPAAAVV